MTEMDAHYDQDTLRKIELIDLKIEEINQRKMYIHTTQIEEDLDRQELNDYIRSLKLTDEQKRLIEDQSRQTAPQAAAGSNWLLFIFMVAGVFLQFYIGLEIYRLFSKGALEMLETAYLVILVAFFAFNMLQVLRYLRIVR